MSERICSKCGDTKPTEEFWMSGHFLTRQCKKCRREYEHNYRKNNLEKCRESRRLSTARWRAKNPGYSKSRHRLDLAKKWLKEARKSPVFKKKQADRYLSMRNNNPSFKLLTNVRRRISLALFNHKKSTATLKLCGCSADFLKSHIESQFNAGMSWDNYGIRGWHIDHKIPVSFFDLSNTEDQKKCFHYTNMQPLWGVENIRKGGINRIKTLK